MNSQYGYPGGIFITNYDYAFPKLDISGNDIEIEDGANDSNGVYLRHGLADADITNNKISIKNEN